MSGNVSSGLKCPRCTKNSIILDEELDELFCSECGMVIPEKYQEFKIGIRTYESGNSSTKTSFLQKALDIGSSTRINSITKDAFGKTTSANPEYFKRIKKLDERSKTYSSVVKNFNKAMSEMEKLKDKLALSDAIIEQAMQMYQKIIKRKRTKGYLIKGNVGACIYASCRIIQTPRTMDVIAKTIDTEKREIRRSYKMIFNELGLGIEPPDPTKYVPRIASIIGFSEKTRLEAIKMIEHAKKTGKITGKHPRGVAAGALHIAGFKTGEPKSEKIIAEKSSIDIGTLIERSKYFEEISKW